MKIFVVGSGGREHVLAEKYSQSKKVDIVFVASGNILMPETNKKIQIIPNLLATDLKDLLTFARKQKIDLVDIAADDQLAAGYVDAFRKSGINAFGPSKIAAEIEWNKVWARKFMEKYNLPTPLFKSFSSEQKAISFINSHNEQLWYIKASGLAAGKGAIRAETKNDAIQAIKFMKQFGTAGKTFVIEEGMIGEEFSLFALCDGNTYKILGTAQDHKTVSDNDKGPNTGGMGCVSPTGSLNSSSIRTIEKEILRPFMNGMKKERRPYTGILYLGGMISNPPTGGGIRIIEFNARWGDPEAEVVLSGLQNDYLDIVTATFNQQLSKITIKSDDKIRISIAGCSRGYPEDYTKVKGKIIRGLEKAQRSKGIKIYGAGIKKVGKNYVVTGGRIFHLVAEGATIREARKRAYKAMGLIGVEGNNLHYRTDIGWRELERTVR